EDDDVNERDDDGGKADFQPPIDRGTQRLLPSFSMPLAIFEHDNRIIHKNTGNEGHGKQRDGVEREVEQTHDDDRGKEADGDRDEYGRRVAPRPQEKYHHDRDEQNAL